MKLDKQYISSLVKDLINNDQAQFDQNDPEGKFSTEQNAIILYEMAKCHNISARECYKRAYDYTCMWDELQHYKQPVEAREAYLEMMRFGQLGLAYDFVARHEKSLAQQLEMDMTSARIMREKLEVEYK